MTDVALGLIVGDAPATEAAVRAACAAFAEGRAEVARITFYRLCEGKARQVGCPWAPLGGEREGIDARFLDNLVALVPSELAPGASF